MLQLRTKKNKSQNEQVGVLMERIKQLEDVNYMLAHNIRGAASNIKMMSDIMLNRENNCTEKEKELLSDHEVLSSINRCPQGLLTSLNDMVDVVSREFKERMAFVDCDMKQIIENVTDQLNGFIYQKHARIILNLAIKRIKYAKVYLENFLYNLISNSIKYSRDDVPLQINITTHEKNGRPIIEIEDNGQGIDLRKNGNKLFKLNQVFHNGGYDSKGVGLFITKSQIESLGGKVMVSSKVNQGTKFTIQL